MFSNPGSWQNLGRRQVGVLSSDNTGFGVESGYGKGPWGLGTWEKMTWVRECHLAGDDQDAVRVLIWG